VLAPQRKAFGKITSVDDLRAALQRWNLGATIALGEGVEIDNSKLDAEQVAREIAQRFALPVGK
jgi:hypothetical protein